MMADLDSSDRATNISDEHPLAPSSLWGRAIVLFSFLLFLAVTSYKLTNSGIWLDEGFDYLVAVMPFDKMMPALMYDCQQPPLYTVLLHFLLKISATELWFRFTSVLMGLFGCVGLYAAVNRAGGWKLATLTVMTYTFFINSVFYNQECSEYGLAVNLLFWVAYFFISLLSRFSRGNATAFVVFCTLALYSQYGAMFPLFAVAVTLFVFYAAEKKWSALQYLLCLATVAFLVFGAPLFWFFLKTQMSTSLYYSNQSPFIPYRGLLGELAALATNLKNTLSYLFAVADRGSTFSSVIFTLYATATVLVVLNAFRRNRNALKYLCISAVLTFLSYYAATRFGVYSLRYPRYALPLLPVLLTASSVLFGECFAQLQVFIKRKNRILSYLPLTLALSFLALVCYFNWTIIERNWQKENVREAVQFLTENGGMEEPLYIYYGAVPAFVFYASQYGLDYGREAVASWGVWGNLKEGIDPGMTRHKNFYYGENLRGRDMSYMEQSIKKSFSGGMPDALRILFSHVLAASEGDGCLEIFEKLGYRVEAWQLGEALVVELRKRQVARVRPPRGIF